MDVTHEGSAVTKTARSGFDQRVCVRDAEAPNGVRSGQLLHIGQDGKLLVMWDGDSKTSLVAHDTLTLNATHRKEMTPQ